VTPPTRVVVADANVLINLLHAARLEKCCHVPGLELVVPNHVWEEISYPAERAALDDALVRGILRIEVITDPQAVELFAELIVHLGRGESACLAIAVEKGWMVASDEKRRFRREARARIGPDRLLGTPELLVLAIQAGLLTIEEADADKAVLEKRRFKMGFSSFRDILR
jgi:predicted nucleic acid-binding protein